MTDTQHVGHLPEASDIMAGLTADEIRAQVEHMLVSDIFVASPQLCSFLRFIVEAALRGEADRLKAYVIGVEVFRRSLRFDANMDPIVRVEATRLRRTIDRYYGGPGLNDPVIIEMPRGSYGPLIRRREAQSPLLVVKNAGVKLRWRLAGVAIIGAFAVAIVIRGGIEFFRSGKHLGTNGAAVAVLTPDRGFAGTPLPGDGMPVLAMQPFELAGSPGTSQLTVGAFFEKLRDAFSRFDTINVTSEPPRTAAVSSAGVVATTMSADQIVDYRFSGAVDYRDDGATDIRLRLMDVSEGTVVWSKTFSWPAAVQDRVAAEDAIIFDVSSTLLQPFGVIRSRDRAKQLASPAVGDPRYRCVVEASEALRSFDPDQNRSARNCLERLTTSDPTFQIGYSYLAAAYFREVQYSLGESANSGVMLDRALAMARRGIELKPESARAYQIMSTVLFFRRNIDAAFTAGEKSMSLNKYDVTIVGDYGGRLILTGEIDRGLEMLNKAAKYGATLASWYNAFLSFGHYLKGEMPDAAYFADQITSDTYLLGLVAKLLVASAVGDSTKLKYAMDRLIAIEPAWQRDPQHELEKFFVNPEIVARLTRDLNRAGLSGKT